MKKIKTLSITQLANVNGGRLSRKYRCPLGVIGYGVLGGITGGAAGAAIGIIGAVNEDC